LKRTSVWHKAILTFAGAILAINGLAGAPEDARTWLNWTRFLKNAVPWWLILVISFLLLLWAWVPAVLARRSPRDVASNVPSPATPQSGGDRVEELEAEIRALKQTLAANRALPDRIVGLLGAGKALNMRDLAVRFEIRDVDAEFRATLEACLGQLVSEGIVEHYSGSIDSYHLAAGWQERVRNSRLTPTAGEG
jgi:hypothetical protein